MAKKASTSSGKKRKVAVRRRTSARAPRPPSVIGVSSPPVIASPGLVWTRKDLLGLDELSAEEIVHVYVKGAAKLRPDISELPPADWHELENWISQHLNEAKPSR